MHSRTAAPQSDQLPPGRLIATCRDMLDTARFTYRGPTPDTLVLGMRHQHGQCTLVFRACDPTHFVGLVASLATRVPAHRRPATAEAVARINMRLRVGGFDIDFDDGELRYRIGLDVENGTFSHEMAGNMLCYAMLTVQHFHAAIMQVAFGDAEPRHAVEGVT